MLALSNNHLLRIATNEAVAEREDIDLGRGPQDKIFGLFMDPTANHVLVCVSVMGPRGERGFETFYIPPGTLRPVLLKKLKGHGITAVAWNPDSRRDDRSTREILLGTNDGLLFECEVDKQERYFKEVHRLDGSEPICGLGLHGVRTAASSPDRKFFVMVTTPNQSHQFVGVTDVTDPVFMPVFLGNPNKRFHDMPGSIERSQLAFFAPYPGPPEYFAWLVGCGVAYGKLDCKNPTLIRRANQPPVETVMVGKQQLWEFTKADSIRKPLSVVVTEFHIVMLYADKYEVLCLLNQKVVMSETLPLKVTQGMTQLSLDPVMETIYAVSPRTLYKIEAVDETRDVWQLYLELGEYDKALDYCSDNPQHLDKVLNARAEGLFEAGNFIEAAALFAQTKKSFEEVALRFLEDGHTNALKTYLLKKLKALEPREKTQLTMVCTWLVEIYLNTLNTLKDEGATDASRDLRDEFRGFLQDPRVQSNLDKATAYDLIASHGNVEDLTFFATLIEDFERVISHHVQSGEYTEALEKLNVQPNLDLYYRFAPTLMQHVPKETVEACMSRPQLDPRQLIPAFIRYQQNGETGSESEASHQAIRYLEWCVGDFVENRDPAIHNYLISLYTKLKDDSQLLRFIERYGDEPHYDKKYALRLCTQENKVCACVAIYGTMGLYEEAVDLALSVDLNLAMKNADLAEDDTDMKKKLWLRIARHVVKEEKNIDKAMSVLQRNDELLKIEDILPFFPDFVRIDHFKEAICESLKKYNQDIETLKQDMNAATMSALHIRSDISELRNKYVVVAGDDACELCSYPLMSRAFYKFPCGHGFHSDCLGTEVIKHLKPGPKRQLERVLVGLRGAGSAGQMAELQSEFDEIVGEECPACGEILIETIDLPFMPPDQTELFMESWSLPGGM